MKKFIKLTSLKRPEKKFLIDPQAIEAITTPSEGSCIFVCSHNNGGFDVTETVDEVLALIRMIDEVKIGEKQ